jgi:eukaryotic-like serine/threonine-protein kinase
LEVKVESDYETLVPRLTAKDSRPPELQGQIPPTSEQITLLLDRNGSATENSIRAFSHEDVPTHLGRLIVRKFIARGGMADILEVHDQVFRRDVACKLLRKEFNEKPHLVERFFLEAQLTANLQHPGIVPVYELGRLVDGRPFFTMKLIQGQTFESMLHGDPSSMSRRLKVFERVCQTLAYCHSSGVIHLDLKPANVMVGAFDEVRLMDWGLARIVENRPTLQNGTTVNEGNTRIVDRIEDARAKTGVDGTPSYMSPEQARGEPVDCRSDVFGLGAILYEILTGSQLYSGKCPSSILNDAAKANLSNVHNKLDRIGSDKPMVRLAHRCIAQDPAERPADAGAVAAEVTSYVESMLQEGMKDWHRFFEISLDLFCVASFEGYFLRVNGNFSRVLGYPEAELISRPFIELVHPDDVAPTINAMAVLFTGNPVHQFRNRYRNAAGSYLELEWSAKSVLEERLIFAVARVVSNHAGSTP